MPKIEENKEEESCSNKSDNNKTVTDLAISFFGDDEDIP